MITDFHVHVFPESMAQRLESILACTSDDITADGILASMSQNSVDYSVALPVACGINQCEDVNDFAMDLNEKSDFIAFGTIHPSLPDWRDELERIKDSGIIGIQLTPDFQGISIDDDIMLDTIEYASKLGLAILIDAGMNISVPDSNRKCTPKKIKIVSRCVKDAKIIATHIGGCDCLNDAEQYIIGTNVYIDTSFITDELNSNQICRMLQNHDSSKILFGSDAPWTPQQKALETLRELKINDALKEKILYKNARNFYANL